MAQSCKSSALAAALLAALLLAGCGGGGNTPATTSTTATASTPAPVTVPDTAAPQLTNDIATDGLNWFNYRRQQMGETALTRNTQIDRAALGHSNYQKVNETITHMQILGKPAFTGAQLPDRLTAAGYQFTQDSYAYGEVISSTGTTTGPEAAESLIAAIYHRFAIFDPSFRESGAGAATAPGGYTYFTTDFAVNGLRAALGTGKFVTYPFASQQNVPIIFYSDYESPDPVSNRNEVGYPISVHADITSTVTVQSFTVKPRGGSVMATQLLTSTTDRDTPASTAAIIPLNVLAPATTYDVQFIGSVDGVAANRSWSFTTK